MHFGQDDFLKNKNQKQIDYTCIWKEKGAENLMHEIILKIDLKSNSSEML